MNVCVVGTGYVGLVTGVCLADIGCNVTCCDIDEQKLELLSKGNIPFFEPGLAEKLLANQDNNNLFFSSNLEDSYKKNSIIFIAVGTPSNQDGSADLTSVFEVSKNIGKSIVNDTIIIVKSTVPIGTTNKANDIIASELDRRKISIDYDVINNPEFLREGSAVRDCMRPDRIIIGCNGNRKTINKIANLYNSFQMKHNKIIVMDIKSSEMTKYASNSMLATRISFMNEISQLCEIVGANVNHVRNGMGADARIGYHYLYPSIGYGGSCFPKDLEAIKYIASENGYNAKIISSTIEVNNNQASRFSDRVVNFFNKKKPNEKINIAIWGLSFKPETDDIREAPSIRFVEEMLKNNYNITAHDPKAINNFKRLFSEKKYSIKYYEDKYDALGDADCMVLLTEWKEYRILDFKKINKRLASSVIFDGRNIYNALELQKKNFEYFQIGVKNELEE